ncbi:unnamed protein product [Prorocentrum cordatum]|uniref:Protein kinase domain-containing protein n=1 Tax=Prorocentrum cordatum TaxID=2364126 RepID=A0ABN9QPL8_9DINO|nr:unnamed protein product [Polarella glacialis]
MGHIVVDDHSGTPFCRLVDFSSATCCVESTPSTTVCGDLPCIAPEMALEAPCVAKQADCWSLWVVLLEAAGGLAELEPPAAKIRSLFSCEGSHARALAVMGGVRSRAVLAGLSGLLEPEPAARAAANAPSLAS